MSVPSRKIINNDYISDYYEPAVGGSVAGEVLIV